MIFGYINGGLGNQLFQIFAIISLSMNSSTPCHFPDLHYFSSSRHAYWNSFLSRLQIFLKSSEFIKSTTSEVVKETNFEYQPFDIELVKRENVLFFGYYQSYKYFENNYRAIYNLIDVNKYKNSVMNKINIFDKTISMHFRLGDYKYLSNCHPTIDLNYYSNCLKYLINVGINLREYKILYFCENNESDIKIVSEIINNLLIKYPYLQFIREEGLEDYEEMILMSLCSHNIIANSTFSWWGAYLNDYSDKIVMYPDVWFGPELSHKNTKDLYPENWIKISVN
jgi:hypothetical protein